MSRNALLTASQREFLRAGEREREEEYTKQQRSYHRREIRERVKTGVHDFQLIYNHLDDVELQKIFDVGMEEEHEDHLEFVHAMRYALQFCYWAAQESPEWIPGMNFEYLLAQAVVSAEQDLNGRSVNPRFYLNAASTRSISEQAVEKIKEGKIDALTVGEMYAFLNMYRESLDPDRARYYGFWRHGTSKEPPKAGEEPFEEWLDRKQHPPDETIDENDNE